MALPAPQLAQADKPRPSIPLAVVAERLGRNIQHCARLCRDLWEPAGQAIKAGNSWFVAIDAHPLLRDALYGAERDLQQIAQLSAQGVKKKYIEIAKARRDILAGFPAFALRCGTTNAHKQLELYRAHLKTSIGKAPSRGTFYGWQNLYFVGGLRELVPARGLLAGEARGSVNGDLALEYIERVIDAGNRIEIAEAIRLFEAMEAGKHRDDPAWRLGSYRSVLLALEKRRPKVMKMLAAKGPRAARASCVPKMLRDFGDIPAGDEYVGDEKTLDVWCRVWTARGWRPIREIKLTAWADMRSRVIVGHRLAAHANSLTILAALKIAIRAFGKPLRLRVDRGKDYQKAGRHGALKIDGALGDGKRGDDKAPALSSILADLGIDYRHVEGYSPWTKPIESFFKTFKHLHDQWFGSFWGGCPSERHEDRQAWVKANLEKLPTLDQIGECVAEAIRRFHHTEHSAPDLFGKTPLQAMADQREGPVRKESDEVLNHLFRCFVGPKLVRRDGVRHEAHWYGHGDARLFKMQGRRVLLAIQPEDAGRATVCDLQRNPLFEVECYEHRGQSIEQVREKHRRLRGLLKPYAKKQAEARRWLTEQDPKTVLTKLADAAERRNPAPADAAPSLTVVRPALEQAIAATGPARSEAASKAVRTGTDDADLGLDDLLDPSGFSAPRAVEEPDEDDDL